MELRTFNSVSNDAESIKPLIKANIGNMICIFDTETTGLAEDAKIIQFSAMRYIIQEDFSLKSIDYLNTYINPEEEIPEDASKINGITNELVANSPTELQAVDAILKYMYESHIWVAYNINFDILKLNHMCQRTGRQWLPHKLLDVLPMARNMFVKGVDVPNHKLSTITTHLFSNEAEAKFHDSLEDVKATGKCLEYFLKIYLTMNEPEKKIKRHVSWASANINERRYDKRIKLSIVGAEYGCIYYDCIKYTWSCKKTKEATKLFDTTDLVNIEQQVINKYGHKYNAHDMYTLARAMMQEKEQKIKTS